MSRRPLALTVSVASAAVLLGLFAWRSPSLRASSAPSATAAASARIPAAAATPRGAAWARYRLTSTQRAALNGREHVVVITEGTWTTIERTGGRVEAQFAASRLDVVGDTAPSAADVAGPIELIYDEGVLSGITFAKGTSRAARALLTGLATTFQSTRSAGPAWTVEEEDLLGRYVAEYRQRGDRVTRTRTRYTALRDATGLSATQAGSIAPTESSELRFDAEGLVSATVRTDSTVTVGKGAVALTMSLSASLVREATDARPLVAGPGRAAVAISNHLDHAARARASAGARVGGKKTPEVLADAAEAAHLDRANPAGRARRGAALRRLSALTQIDAAAAGAIAAIIRLHPDDKDAVGLLLGSLSSSPDPSATNALASLLDDAELPGDVQDQVMMHLALTRAPTDESAEALTRALAGPSGNVAALALGAEAHELHGGDTADEAIDQLLERYAQASTTDERRLALLALANSGSLRVLDVMKSALQSGDFELSRVAAFGLRFIPGDEVDALLLALLQGGSPVVMEVIRAVAYRSPALWTPRLEAAKEQFARAKPALDAIQAVLAQWAAAGPERP
jgi:hypothetical protein